MQNLKDHAMYLATYTCISNLPNCTDIVTNEMHDANKDLGSTHNLIISTQLRSVHSITPKHSWYI